MDLQEDLDNQDKEVPEEGMESMSRHMALEKKLMVQREGVERGQGLGG